MTKDTQRKLGWKRRSVVMGISCCLSAGILLCGCGKTLSLERPYSFTERPFPLTSEEEEIDFEPLFASDLCVVEEEGAFSPEETTSEAGVLFNLSDRQVLYSKNAFERLYPASTTKVMTILIAVKYGNLSDSVTVTQEAMISEAGATLADLKVGDVLTMEQLLYGLMLPSGNDAGAAIAIHMAGSIEAFADLMNQEAKALGATGTHFMNPHGLTDENHYTTAYDLYLIFNEALKYQKFREVTRATTYTATYTDIEGNPVTKTWEGGNWYMVGKRETPEGLTGFSGKTGTTQAAGYCLVMASRDLDNKEYISVVLKAPSRPGLYDNMTKLITKIVD